MMEIYQRLGTGCDVPVDVRVVLTHEQRDRGRLRVFSTEGEEVRIFLTRGAPLQVGEYLRTQCGRHVFVEGAVEPLLQASCDDWRLFSRACYHLGNRHVKVQVGERILRIQPDHVLEEMLVLLGLQVMPVRHVFIPETGAYGNGSIGGGHHHHALHPVHGGTHDHH